MLPMTQGTGAQPDQSDPLGEAAHLVIVRHPGPMDGLRAYSIFVDTLLVGDISAGETKCLAVSAGEHTLMLRLDFGRSRDLSIIADSAVPTEVHCRSRGYSPLRMILNHRDYIELFERGESLPRQRSLKEEMKLRMLVLLTAVLVSALVILPASLAAGGHGPILSIAIGVFLGLVGVWCTFVPAPRPRSGTPPDEIGLVKPRNLPKV